LDISRTTFRVAGEPFTPARLRIFAAAGCNAAPRYSMAEVGMIGIGCPHADEPDEVHLLGDKVAVITRPPPVGVGDADVEALLITTVLPSCPKLLINVQVDDYGVFPAGGCGCPLERLGIGRRLHTIRSYEKLTSAGMHFLGGDVLRLVEEVLPCRFGGLPTDFQLVEEDVEGLPRVYLYASPRLGTLDEKALIKMTLETLGGRDAAQRMMAEEWRQGAVLRVRRQEPLETRAGKILPLHVRR
jgi:hypothetical protein